MPRTNHWPTIARLITDSALWPRPRVSVTAIASAQNESHRAHRADDDAERGGDGGQDDPRAEAIDEAADADREDRADERRPQIQLRVIDAADAEIGDQRLGDEAEALRPARQRADHGRRREQQHDPPVTTRGHCRLYPRMPFRKRRSLAVKIPLIMSLLLLAALAAMSVASYLELRRALDRPRRPDGCSRPPTRWRTCSACRRASASRRCSS